MDAFQRAPLQAAEMPALLLILIERLGGSVTLDRGDIARIERIVAGRGEDRIVAADETSGKVRLSSIDNRIVKGVQVVSTSP